MTDKIIKMSNLTFECNIQGQALHHSGITSKRIHLEEIFYEGNDSHSDSQRIARDIVNDIFNGVFTTEESEQTELNKSPLPVEENPLVGDHVSVNKIRSLTEFDCIHNFSEEELKLFESEAGKLRTFRYTSGEPTPLNYANYTECLNDLKNSRSCHCEICDNQSKYIIPKDHECPNKLRKILAKDMATDVNVDTPGIVTIQKVFEPDYNYQSPSVSALPKIDSEELQDEEDSNELDERECDSLGALEQKSDILDLVNNQSMKSLANAPNTDPENLEEWEKTEESLIQVINLEWVEGPSPERLQELRAASDSKAEEQIQKVPEEELDEETQNTEESALILSKFDDEKLEMVDLSLETRASHGGKGDDLQAQPLQQPEVTGSAEKLQDRIFSDSEDIVTDSSVNPSKGSVDAKKKKWKFVRSFRCFFGKKNKKRHSEAAENES